MEILEKNQQEFLNWHRPEVKRLSVSLDTQAGVGSLSDGGGAYFSPCV